MPRVVVVLLVTALAFFAAAVAIGMLAAPHLKALYLEVMLGSQETQVPCGQRPTVADAVQVMDAHVELIRQIEAIHYTVLVTLDETACPGRGTLVFHYGGFQHRREIERLIDGDTFFGVPYSLMNW